MAIQPGLLSDDLLLNDLTSDEALALRNRQTSMLTRGMSPVEKGEFIFATRPDLRPWWRDGLIYVPSLTHPGETYVVQDHVCGCPATGDCWHLTLVEWTSISNALPPDERPCLRNWTVNTDGVVVRRTLPPEDIPF